MKKITISLIAVLVLASTIRLSAQTVAMDFTQADCDGSSHHLFSELDQGKVIILTFVELGCSSCIVATNGLKNIVPQFAISHPDRVKVYNIGYTNSYSCSQMLNWKSSNGFTFPVFTGGSTQVNYYGGMGMPTIAIVGANTHTVYFKKLGYESTDDPDIISAIQTALQYNPQGIVENLATQGIQIYPTLFSNSLNMRFDNKVAGKVTIVDLMGRDVFSQEINGQDQIQITTNNLGKGMYSVRFRNSNGQIGSQKIVKD